MACRNVSRLYPRKHKLILGKDIECWEQVCNAMLLLGLVFDPAVITLTRNYIKAIFCICILYLVFILSIIFPYTTGLKGLYDPFG